MVTFASIKPKKMSIKKQYFKTKSEVKVTLSLPADAAPNAKEVFVAGDFNDWNESTTKMRRLKSGEFKADIKLEPGREYQFRYKIDGERWENDWEADKYVPSELTGEDNSVIVL
jgi:1,4-alpha-glucan branching enzyme